MTILRRPIFLVCLAFFLPALLLAFFLAQDSKIELLPGTMPLEWPEEDLSERLMDGAHAFVERQIAESKEKRAQFWNYDFSSPEAYEKSIEPNRVRFRKMIGVVDERVSPVTMERFGEGEVPGLVAENEWFRVWQVRWPVLEGVWGEGLLVLPTDATPDVIGDEGKTTASGTKFLSAIRPEKPAKYLIAGPYADTSPEEFLGFGSDRLGALTGLAKAGFTVIIPTLIDRQPYLNGDSRLEKSQISHREWIYRQAFQMGRHVIGYEVQKVLAAIDWIEAGNPDAAIGCYGYGEGGLIAWFATAIDQRVGSIALNGLLGELEAAEIWRQPICRNLFGFDRDFGWEGAMDLLRYRNLWFLGEVGPHVQTSKGNLTNFGGTFEIFSSEVFDRLALHPGPPDWGFSMGGNFFPNYALDFFTGTERFKMTGWFAIDPPLEDCRDSFSSKSRHDRLFRQLENHVQSLIPKADDLREETFLFQAEPKLRPGKWSTSKEHPTLDPANFIENARSFRKKFDEEAMGKFDEPLAPPNPRSRKILETENWTAWDVVLDVYEPEFFAWGTLLLPKDLKPGEKRPVVVCQHGRNGVPRDCIDAGSSAYNDFAAKLAERGFITFAPHNLYRGEDRYRWLDRKANSIGCTLFSFIIPSHRQILDWLKTQPNVDPGKIAFYGLSYGGETAMRVPPVIEDYAVVICSGDFNQWTRKVAAVDFPGSFMNTIEWEMPYWNLGNTFDYAEMAALIFPRPFMVERGHHDRVSRDHWVAHEYAKVRWLYAQFGLEDKIEIEYFQGGHSINGKGTFDFLHKHLDWPKPEGVD